MTVRQIPTLNQPPMHLPAAILASDLAARQAPAQDWVLPDALPAREVGILAGADGTSKSMLALLAAISIATQTPWAGGLLPAPTTSGRVVYVAGEDDTDELHRRIRAIVTGMLSLIPPPPPGVRLLVSPRDKLLQALAQVEIIALDGNPLRLMIADRQDALPVETEAVAELGQVIAGARLIILDPLVMFHSVNENDNLHMDTIMRCIQRMVRRAGACAALVVHHAGQSSIREGGDDQMLGRGGTALNSAARAVFTVRKPAAAEAAALAVETEIPALWRAVRGPKVSRAAERAVAYCKLDQSGVPWYTPAPAWVAGVRSVQRGRKGGGDTYHPEGDV